MPPASAPRILRNRACPACPARSWTVLLAELRALRLVMLYQVFQGASMPSDLPIMECHPRLTVLLLAAGGVGPHGLAPQLAFLVLVLLASPPLDEPVELAFDGLARRRGASEIP